MKNEVIENVLQHMARHLTDQQLADLKGALYICLQDYELNKKETSLIAYEDHGTYYLNRFLLEKGAHGLSDKTIGNYRLTIRMFLEYYNKSVSEYTDEDVICYLEVYRRARNVSFSRIRNMQSALSSFFTWLCKRKYITSNPLAQLDTIKIPKKVKQPFTQEELELMRMHCNEIRDLALIETLYSTGVRVSELVALNRDDISFINKDVLVMGKGSKQRETYINASASVYLKLYLNSRTDDDPALFVGLRSPHKRLDKNGIEAVVKRIGKAAGIQNVHPHRFRRTFATNMLERGMPIEQVSKLLGHTKLDTTQIYCTIDQETVKASHKKYCV